MAKAKMVPGHTLWYEWYAGAPHDKPGKRIWDTGIAWRGRAKCSCGELSELLLSGNSRKQWHREHKERVSEA